jgi:hypothetical protein
MGASGLLVVKGVAEEVEAIAVAAGDGLGHRAERGEDAAHIGEALGEHLHLHELALVRACEDGARWRQPRIDRRRETDWFRRRLRGGLALGRVEAEVGVAGRFGGASAGAFGEVAFGQGLHSPGDAFDKPGAVAGEGGLAEQFGERDRWPDTMRDPLLSPAPQASPSASSGTHPCVPSTRRGFLAA